MGELKITVEQVKELMTQMAKTDLGQLSIECGDFKLKLSAKKKETAAASSVTGLSAVKPLTDGAFPGKENIASPTEGNVVKAPIVGTFYAASSPEASAFVSVGKEVKKGEVLFIIESMKLMNEVQSEFDGVVQEILVKDGDPLEFGQPVMVIE